jgi:hypothetical protein
VRRPEPAGGHDEACTERLPKGRLEPVGTVSDDEDALRLDPADAQLAGEERAVLVCAATADELAPRDEDDRCRIAEISVQYGTRRQGAMVGRART